MQSTMAGASGAEWLNKLKNKGAYVGTGRLSLLEPIQPNECEMQKTFVVMSTANKLIHNPKLDSVAVLKTIASRSQTEVLGEAHWSRFINRLNREWMNPPIWSFRASTALTVLSWQTPQPRTMIKSFATLVIHYPRYLWLRDAMREINSWDLDVWQISMI